MRGGLDKAVQAASSASSASSAHRLIGSSAHRLIGSSAIRRGIGFSDFCKAGDAFRRLYFFPLLVPKLRLGTHLSWQLCCLPRPARCETEFRPQARSQTEFGNEEQCRQQERPVRRGSGRFWRKRGIPFHNGFPLLNKGCRFRCKSRRLFHQTCQLSGKQFLVAAKGRGFPPKGDSFAENLSAFSAQPSALQGKLPPFRRRLTGLRRTVPLFQSRNPQIQRKPIERPHP